MPTRLQAHFEHAAYLANLQSGRLIATTNEAHLVKIALMPEFQVCRKDLSSWKTAPLIVIDLAAALRELAKVESMILGECGNFGDVIGTFKGGRLWDFGRTIRMPR